ncbi:MAG: cytochrome c3 family protein [Calditerrivibrio sp.]|nr:cytochrome c3 family protein [Calditerrivibrio sp.]
MVRVLLSFIMALITYNISFASSCAVYNCHADDGSGRWGPHNFVRIDRKDTPCAPCHKPHNAGNLIPLWNESNVYDDGVAYKAYVSPSNTLDGVQDSSINPISKACMTCHDGMSETTGFTANYFSSFFMGRLDIDYSKANHPIGVEYGVDTNLNNNLLGNYVVGQTGTYKLVNNKVECITCHDPHKKGSTISGYTKDVKKLLRSTDYSKFCEECHKK